MRHPKARVKNSKAEPPRYQRRKTVKILRPAGVEKAVNPFTAAVLLDDDVAGDTTDLGDSELGNSEFGSSELSTSSANAETIASVNTIPTQLLPPTERVETPTDNEGKILNVNITYGVYESFLQCPVKFQNFRRKRAETTESAKIMRQRVLGRMVEGISAESKGASRNKRTKEMLKEVPARERSKALATVRKSVAVHDRMLSRSDAEEVFQQQKFSYADAETGWILRAKPDIVEYKRQKNGSWIIRVIDEKISRANTDEHEGQLRFMGLVVRLVLERQIAKAVARGEQAERFQIELVVRLTGTIDVRARRNHVLNFLNDDKLFENVRNVCGQIDAAYATREFQTTPGMHCRRCPFRYDCSASQFHHQASRIE